MYAMGGWGEMLGGLGTNQEILFWATPFFFTVYYCGLPSLGFPLLPYLLTQWRTLSPIHKTMIVTVFSMSLMLIPWADRFLQFAMIPLAVLIVSYTSRLHGIPRWIWIVFLATAFTIFYTVQWLWIFFDVYYVDLLTVW